MTDHNIVRMVHAIEERISGGGAADINSGGGVQASVDGTFLADVKMCIRDRSKTDKMRIFDPETNQKARAYAMDYRKYHDIWIPDQQIKTCFTNVKEELS